MKDELYLYGWSVTQWLKVLEWAGEKSITVYDIVDEDKWPIFMEARCKWLNAGGPISGPSDKLVFKI